MDILKRLIFYQPPTTNHQQSTNSGLTLIELLVVMVIISILASAIWGNFMTSLVKGRDSRRKQDLDAFTKSLELYFNDNRSYPLPTQIIWGGIFANPKNSSVVYMQKLPSDPSAPITNYCYVSDGTYYKIYTNLENTSDAKIIPTITCAPSPGVNYNYGISSWNTNP